MYLLYTKKERAWYLLPRFDDLKLGPRLIIKIRIERMYSPC